MRNDALAFDIGFEGLLQEFAEIRIQLEKLHALFLGTDDVNFLAAARESYIEILDELILESSTVDMLAVSFTCEFIKANMLEMDFKKSARFADLMATLYAWPIIIQNYLAEPTNNIYGFELINLMNKSCWPHPLPSDMGDEILQDILDNVSVYSNDTLVQFDDDCAESVSIRISAETDQDLITEYIAETKKCVGQLRIHIAYIVHGKEVKNNTIAGLRLAHTLKGSSHIVGVTGISNILHHLETVLVNGLNEQIDPTGRVNELLLDASDCLMKMIEAVDMRIDAPENCISILKDLIAYTQGEHSEPQFEAMIVKSESIENTENVPQALESPMVTSSEEFNSNDEFIEYDVKRNLNAVSTGVLQFPVEVVEEMLRMVQESVHVNNRLQNIVDSLSLDDSIDSEYQDIFSQYDDQDEDSFVTLKCSKATNIGFCSEANQLLEQQYLINHRLNEIISVNRMVPVAKIVNKLQLCVKKACESTQKEAELIVTGEQLLIDHQQLYRITEGLMHVLRNAVDHGVESMKTRVQQGKSFVGKILLSFAQGSSNSVIIRCIDDGQGLNFEKINEMAIRRGLLKYNEIKNNEELAKLIFKPGFSTRSKVSQISGRGMGMDVVFHTVQELGGSLDVIDHASAGTEFVICIPRVF